jgi:hypothetical protein
MMSADDRARFPAVIRIFLQADQFRLGYDEYSLHVILDYSSPRLFMPESDQRIYLHCSARRNIASERGNYPEQNHHA